MTELQGALPLPYTARGLYDILVAVAASLEIPCSAGVAPLLLIRLTPGGSADSARAWLTVEKSMAMPGMLLLQPGVYPMSWLLLTPWPQARALAEGERRSTPSA